MTSNAAKAARLHIPSYHIDPSGKVDLDRPHDVFIAIDAIMTHRYGVDYGRPILHKAIEDVAHAFSGDYPGLLRCDTFYHDLRHALDVALATARLIDGHSRSVTAGAPEVLSNEQALAGVLFGLFHDIGLLRKTEEAHLEGASLSPVHEQRSAAFAESYLAQTPLAHLAPHAELIMITRLDYKMRADWAPWQQALASLIGTADLVSQLADRCYLEKCRDFLFIEFSAIGLTGPGNPYPDQPTLLRKTPGFYADLLHKRMVEEYHEADRYMAAHFDGNCPYSAAIDRNFRYLDAILKADDFSQLRRTPQRVIDGH